MMVSDVVVRDEEVGGSSPLSPTMHEGPPAKGGPSSYSNGHATSWSGSLHMASRVAAERALETLDTSNLDVRGALT
jgi:hypothetical protein